MDLDLLTMTKSSGIRTRVAEVGVESHVVLITSLG